MDEQVNQKAKAKWLKSFDEAMEFDSWGQLIEASEAYRKLAAMVQSFEEEYVGESIPEAERTLLNRFALVTRVRAQAIEDAEATFSLNDLRKVRIVVENAFTPTSLSSSPFPIDLTPYQSQLNRTTPTHQHDSSDDEDDRINTKGTLLPRPPPSATGTQVSLMITKIGLKKASQYIEPFATISVLGGELVDAAGTVIEKVQDTPVMLEKEENYVLGSCEVHLQTDLESWGTGACIALEFKHYKPKKEKVSTKAWSFMDVDKLQAGDKTLQIFKKPLDPRRRKTKLLSVKPLYCHVTVTLRKS